MTRLGERVGGAAANDPLIARGGASAFMQHVLVPELGIRLISEDMKVDEKEAYRILEESRELGEKFNPGGNEGDMYGDDEDGDTWVDVNATQRRRSMKMDVDEWEEMDY